MPLAPGEAEGAWALSAGDDARKALRQIEELRSQVELIKKIIATTVDPRLIDTIQRRFEQARQAGWAHIHAGAGEPGEGLHPGAGDGVMAEKRYVVPEGMRRAFFDEAHDGPTWNLTECEHMLTAAIKWLAENPIVPDAEQVEQMAARWRDGQGNFLTYAIAAKWIATEWQRRMFLEPEIPAALGDVAGWLEVNFQDDPRKGELLEVFARIYRRGQNDGAKNGRV